MASSTAAVDVTTLSIEELNARVDLYENCLRNLKKDLVPYLTKQAGAKKESHPVSALMRNVASNESNQKLQNVLFFCAQRYENVESRRAVFKRCGEQTTAVLDDAKKLISTPYREIIADVALARKAAIASHKEQIDSALPIHDAMFENHRLRSILKVVTNVLRTELRYHCGVIEELSSVLTAIGEVAAEFEGEIL